MRKKNIIKDLNNHKLFCLVLLFCFGAIINPKINAQTDSSISTNIDWATFLEKHDMVWTQNPKIWYEAPFLGNGMLGSSFHQDSNYSIRISLGRSDVEDHRTTLVHDYLDHSRLPIGYFNLNTKGKITGFEGRVDLYDAEARARITTELGYIDVRGFVHSDDMLIIYEITPSEGEADAQLEFIPFKALPPARRKGEQEVAENGENVWAPFLNWATLDYEYNPDPVVSNVGDVQLCKQTLLEGGETGTAWKIRENTDGSKILVVSIEHSYPESNALDNAYNTIMAVENESLTSLISRHREWWHNYYPLSFLSLDDTQIESFYWIQIYKFASGAREGRAFMDTHGPWIVEDGVWANGWFNLNTQISYLFPSTANRMVLSESLFKGLDDNFQTLVDNLPASYNGEAAALSPITPQTFKNPRGDWLGFMGELLWTCHDYWLMVERTMDEDRIKNKFFPLLKKAVNFYMYNKFEGTDGKLHLPVTKSPEYSITGEDVNFNLALFRWGCKILIDLNNKYSMNDPLQSDWEDVVARLVDYPTDENGFMVAKEVPFAKGHRHYSHLLMIYPLMEVHWDQQENREVIKTSVDHWLSFENTSKTGYSYTAGAAMYALQGEAELAKYYIDFFIDLNNRQPKDNAKIHSNTMYTETTYRWPVTETPFSFCESLQQMMLQSWGGKIHVFPAIPSSWQNLNFDNFLAAGGFEVSASRKNGTTAFIRIKSLAGEPCILKTDLSSMRIEGINENSVTEIDDATFEINLQKGEEVILYAEGVSSAIILPVESQSVNENLYGLKGEFSPIANTCTLPWADTDATVNNTTLQYRSGKIDISCASQLEITMDIESTANMEDDDYLNAYYKVDGGELIPISENFNVFGSKSLSATIETGNLLELFINGKNDANDEIHSISNIKVDLLKGDNLASNGTATQSSTIANAVASRAIDGDTNGTWSNGSVTHTSGNETYAWWQVDLTEDHNIGYINVYNRTGSVEEMERLADFTVLVIDSNGNTTYQETVTAYPDPSVTINVGNVQGKIVRIQSNLPNTPITLAEVEVFEGGSLSVSTTILEEKIKIYPNSLKDEFTITLSDTKTASYTVLNLVGQTVLSGDINRNYTRVDATTLSSGIYLLRVSSTSGNYTKKIIKN